jgi:pre-rRNA-processing protein IPI1
VRSTLHALHRFYLLSLPCAILAPHLPTLLLYTTSGMSHIYPDVRLDALRTLDVLLAAAPRAVAHGWDAHDTGAARVMAGYRDLLGLAQSANSTVASDLSAAAKVRLLSSLRSFVEAAASSARSDEAPKEDEAALRCPTWFFRPAFNSASVYDAFASAFTRASTPTLQLGQVPALLDATLAKPAGEAAWSNSDMQSSLSALQSSLAPAASASSSSSRASSKQTYASLFSSLAPLLLSSFLDSAPEAFSPSRDIAASSSGRTAAIPPLPLAAELCCVIVELTLVLWRAMGRCSQSGTGSGVEEEQAWRHLDSLLSKIDGYFPFSAFSSSSSSATNAGTSAPHPALAASDRRYAELSALHALHAPRAAGRSSKSLRGQQARLEQVQRHMRALLVDASSARFDWSAPLDSTSAPPPPPAATGSAVALEAAALVDLMPSLWLLLSQPRAECGEAEAEQSPQAVYADLLELWRTSRGETKRLTTHLLAFLSFVSAVPSPLRVPLLPPR